MRAHYLAELFDADLVQGRGEWEIVNPGPGAAPLPLAPLSLALSRCAWEDGSRAVVGDLSGKGQGVWVESVGSAAFFFDWSCRGAVTPQGLTFDLRLPPCPQTMLELKLPVDSWPAHRRQGELAPTGQLDAGRPDKRLWKLRMAGKTQLEADDHESRPAGPPPMFVQTQARQLVTPDRVAADFEFQIEVPRGAVHRADLRGRQHAGAV